MPIGPNRDFARVPTNVFNMRLTLARLEEQFRALQRQVAVQTARSELASQAIAPDAYRILEAENLWEGLGLAAPDIDQTLTDAIDGKSDFVDALEAAATRANEVLVSRQAEAVPQPSDVEIMESIVTSDVNDLDVAGIMRYSLSDPITARDLERSLGVAHQAVALAYARQTGTQIGDEHGVAEIGANPVGSLNLATISLDAAITALDQNATARAAVGAATLLDFTALGADTSARYDITVRETPDLGLLQRRLALPSPDGRASVALSLMRSGLAGHNPGPTDELAERLVETLEQHPDHAPARAIRDALTAVARGEENTDFPPDCREAVDDVLVHRAVADYTVAQLPVTEQAQARERLASHEPASRRYEALRACDTLPREARDVFQTALDGRPPEQLRLQLEIARPAWQTTEREALMEVRDLTDGLRNVRRHDAQHADLLEPTIQQLAAISGHSSAPPLGERETQHDDLGGRVEELVRPRGRQLDTALGTAVGFLALSTTNERGVRDSAGAPAWRQAREAGMQLGIRVTDEDARLRRRGQVGASLELAAHMANDLTLFGIRGANLTDGFGPAFVAHADRSGVVATDVVFYAGYDPFAVVRTIDNIAAAYEDGIAIAERQLPATVAVLDALDRVNPADQNRQPLRQMAQAAAAQLSDSGHAARAIAAEGLPPGEHPVDLGLSHLRRVVDAATIAARPQRDIRVALGQAGVALARSLRHSPNAAVRVLSTLPSGAVQYVPGLDRLYESHDVQQPPADNRRLPDATHGETGRRRPGQGRRRPGPDNGPQSPGTGPTDPGPEGGPRGGPPHGGPGDGPHGHGPEGRAAGGPGHQQDRSSGGSGPQGSASTGAGAPARRARPHVRGATRVAGSRALVTRARGRGPSASQRQSSAPTEAPRGVAPSQTHAQPGALLNNVGRAPQTSASAPAPSRPGIASPSDRSETPSGRRHAVESRPSAGPRGESGRSPSGTRPAPGRSFGPTSGQGGPGSGGGAR